MKENYHINQEIAYWDDLLLESALSEAHPTSSIMWDPDLQEFVREDRELITYLN